MMTPNYTSPFQDPSPSDTSPEVWFENMSSPLPPEPPKHSWKKFIILVGCVLVVIGGVLVVVLAHYFSTPRCLTKEDYTSLTGQAYSDELSSKDNFYTYVVNYKANSPIVSDSIRKLGAFYQEHADTSLLVTLTSDFSGQESHTLATERIAALKTSLLKVGIPEQSITVNEPQWIEQEPDAILDPMATISVTSASTCRG